MQRWKVQRERQSKGEASRDPGSASRTTGFRKATSGPGMATACDRREGGGLCPLHSPAQLLPYGCHRDVKWVRVALGLYQPSVKAKRGERERFFWSLGKSAMLGVLPPNRGEVGRSCPAELQAPTFLRWTSSSGRGKADGKVPAHGANFRLHSSSCGSPCTGPCESQLRDIHYRATQEGTQIHTHTCPCTCTCIHASEHVHMSMYTQVPEHTRVHTPFLPAGLGNAPSCLVRGRESMDSLLPAALNRVRPHQISRPYDSQVRGPEVATTQEKILREI